MWLPTAVACSFSFCSAVHGSVTTRVCVLLMAGFWAVASLGLLQMYPEVKTPGHKASSVPVIIVMLVSVMSWCPGHPSSPALHPLSSPRRSSYRQCGPSPSVLVLESPATWEPALSGAAPRGPGH